MKGVKLKIGIVAILILIMIIPFGSCASSVNDTVYLSPGQMTSWYFIGASEGDTVRWRFQTYNDSFTVAAMALNFWGMIS